MWIHVYVLLLFFFFKQKTAYEMRISDWSSDVCSSDLSAPPLQERVAAVSATIRCPTCQGLSIQDSPSVLATGSRQIVEQQLREGRTPDEVRQIGRASCRERVCQYV